jgi:small subunit ribosomal protein S8
MFSLSNLLSIIRNGELASRPYIEIKCTKEIQYNKLFAILNQFRQEGIIRGYSFISIQTAKLNKNNVLSYKLIIFLKYDERGKSVRRSVKQISTPGRLKYVSTHSLWQPQTSSGFYILSTPYGLLTDIEARYYNVGGEVLVSVI